MRSAGDSHANNLSTLFGTPSVPGALSLDGRSIAAVTSSSLSLSAIGNGAGYWKLSISERSASVEGGKRVR